MPNWLFVILLFLLLTPLYIWGFTFLPRERWQIICAIPAKKMADGSWQGLNLTYYGLFNALALCAAVTLVFFLSSAAGMSFTSLAVIVLVLLGVCLPASGLIARWVEKKPHTFSVGAAAFMGLVAGPWLILLMEMVVRQLTGVTFDTMAVLAALVVGYALGEGIGRLACISFGCCYGRPVDQLPPVVRRCFSWAAFTYIGATKKIAYAHRLEGRNVFAVQAVTAVLYTFSALAGILLYLNGDFAWAYFVCLLVTQGWRFLSEFLRFDYRGDRKISVYQIMSLLTIPYGLLPLFLFPTTRHHPDLLMGLHALWHPAVILFLIGLGIIMFLRTGFSQVTGSSLVFHVNMDRV